MIVEAHGMTEADGSKMVLRVKLSSGEILDVTPAVHGELLQGLQNGTIPFLDINRMQSHGERSFVTGTVSDFHQAALDGDLSRVIQFLEANPSLRDTKSGNKDYTALALAAREGRSAVVEYLLKKGANPNVQNSVGGYPIHAAANSGHAEVIRLLLSHGANRNARNGSGETAFDIARSKGHQICVGVLS